MADTLKCSKCGGEMEEGLLEDTFLAIGKTVQNWAKISNLNDRKRIKSYRCKTCGYLESYAK